MTNNGKQAVQQEFLLFPLKARKGEIPSVGSHIHNVRTKANIGKGKYPRAIFKDHAAIKGFAMVVIIPYLVVAGILNIRSPYFFIPLVIFACGLFCPTVAQYIWPRVLTILKGKGEPD